MDHIVDFLENLADTLDGWAEQSVRGSWSTHQVAANRAEADRCRRKAAQLKRELRSA
ncbi:hypothetical protein [Bradyrhizobium elkanii]|uniref:hypothetical protein n=1 Tax=Bradyrhizobium elkanii TaxID=29448 RepID=UPI0012BB6079|nr:hypothetical protein [Bradyrhizobium elkanii]WLC11872.1 hypothetical protein QIH86_21655 [Bradyrhizobium elkanii USDA 94]